MAIYTVHDIYVVNASLSSYVITRVRKVIVKRLIGEREKKNTHTTGHCEDLLFGGGFNSGNVTVRRIVYLVQCTLYNIHYMHLLTLANLIRLFL